MTKVDGMSAVDWHRGVESKKRGQGRDAFDADGGMGLGGGSEVIGELGSGGFWSLGRPSFMLSKNGRIGSREGER